jgi:hypothetical protein
MSNPLPVVPLATAEVDVAGTTITVRRLSRSEVLKVHTEYGKDTADAAEAFIVSCGVGCSPEEARAWLDSTDHETAGVVIEKILSLSNMIPDPVGQDGKVPDPKSAGSASS